MEAVAADGPEPPAAAVADEGAARAVGVVATS